MYDEINKLKREKEELWWIWERVRWTGPARGSGGGGMMYLRRSSAAFSGRMRTEPQQVRCMVQVSDASNNMSCASNINCNSNRDCK